jgi:hypothetical protein
MVKVIEIRNFGRKEEEVRLSRLVEDTLDGNDCETGAVEGASATARNATSAIGELLSLMVSKQMISLDEALKIIGAQHRDIRLEDDGQKS